MNSTLVNMFRIVLGLVVLVSGFSCSDDDPAKPKPTPPVQAYQDLTEKDHVLNNLELCHNELNAEQYKRLLDDPNFTFYFSDYDFGVGRTPERWGLDADTIAVGGMFDPLTAVYKVLSLGLKLAPSGEAWQPTTPDQDRFPGETWYYKSFTYDITAVVEAQPENFTLIAQAIWAVITVRQSEVDGKQVWRIVEWRDDAYAATGRTAGTAGSAGTQETRWGTIKDLYYNGPVYEAMTQPDGVLHNLELSYNQRNLVEYERILDDPNFTYFFSPEDAMAGRTPEDWGIDDDLTSAGNMFDPSFLGPPVTSINLSLQYPAGGWIATEPDQVQFPGETWFFKAVRYNLTVEVATIPDPTTYLMNNLAALITVRQSEFEGKQRWRIVWWQDDVDLFSVDGESQTMIPSMTWGIIKAMYLD